MKISKPMIEYYLGDITMGWFDPETLPPDDVTGYHHCIMQMRLGAMQHRDMDALKIAFEYLLSRPEIDCGALGDGRYPYDDDEVREIIHYAWKTLWPDAKPVPASELSKVELVEIPLQEWWDKREQLMNS